MSNDNRDELGRFAAGASAKADAAGKLAFDASNKGRPRAREVTKLGNMHHNAGLLHLQAEEMHRSLSDKYKAEGNDKKAAYRAGLAEHHQAERIIHQNSSSALYKSAARVRASKY